MHYEALIQWASLAKRNGNDAHAQILQNRAERVKNAAVNRNGAVETPNPTTGATGEICRVLPARARPMADCWEQEIGVNGNASCSELARHIHCRNCPVYSKLRGC